MIIIFSDLLHSNKDENVLRFAIRGELLEREREWKREKESKRERERKRESE